MRMKFRGLAAIVGVAALGLLIGGTAACQRYRLQIAGGVKDADGKPLQGCRVELLVRRELVGSWTGYVSREVVTSSGGTFSFNVFAPSSRTYRLRVMNPGYQEWLLDAPSPGAPNHVHVTLRRLGEAASSAASAASASSTTPCSRTSTDAA